MYTLVRILGGGVEHLREGIDSDQLLHTLNSLDYDTTHYVVSGNRVEPVSKFLLRALGAALAKATQCEPIIIRG